MAALPTFQRQDVSSAQDAANAITEAAAVSLRGAGLTTVKHTVPGEARQELSVLAEKMGADCIFVGARGLSRVDRILLGSVSTAVAMHAPCSVEVVRQSAS
jgi:nucleotide-binding universal stress UspA family protein